MKRKIVASTEASGAISEQDVLNGLKQFAKATGRKLYVKDGAVRLTSAEDDMCQFGKLKDLIPTGVSKQDFMEDPMDNIEFADTIGIHHASDISEYNYEKRRLNRKYFPSIYPQKDVSWMREGVEFTKSTHPGTRFKFVSTAKSDDGYVKYVRTRANGQFSSNVIWVRAEQLVKLYESGVLKIEK